MFTGGWSGTTMGISKQAVTQRSHKNENRSQQRTLISQIHNCVCVCVCPSF